MGVYTQKWSLGSEKSIYLHTSVTLNAHKLSIPSRFFLSTRANIFSIKIIKMTSCFWFVAIVRHADWMLIKNVSRRIKERFFQQCHIFRNKWLFSAKNISNSNISRIKEPVLHIVRGSGCWSLSFRLNRQKFTLNRGEVKAAHFFRSLFRFKFVMVCYS